MPYPGGFEDREDEDDFNEEEEDDGHGGYIRSANDHVILLVDARKNMMEQMDQNANDDSGTYFEAAMKMAAQVMRTKVVANDKHRVGVTLFGTQKTSDLEETNPNVYVVLELAPPSAKRIRDLENLAKGEVDVAKKYGSLGEEKTCPLRSGLWSCQTEFMTIKHPGDYKRVFLFTNDDDPLKGNEEEKKKVKVVAKDAIETSIEIQLFHMKRGAYAFDPNKFYRAILTGDGDDYNEQSIGEGAGEVSELMDRVRRKEFKKRTLGRMPFYISEGSTGKKLTPKVSFDVKLYAMIHAAKKTNPIYLDARRNKPVQVISKFMDDKTGAQLDEHEIRRYLEFCGERAYVTTDEMAGLKGVSPKGLVLLGFSKMETLRPDFNSRSPYFLYPDEESTIGSAKAFISLHAAMLDKGVYALARLTRANNAAPRMVALLPQAEEVEDGVQVSPPGFHVVTIPYAEEIRELKSAPEGEVTPEVSEEGVSTAEALVKALRLDGLDCRHFENPVLQRHYAALEAIALSEEEIAWEPDKHDTTQPNDMEIDAAISPLVEAFKTTYGGDQEDDVPAPGAKRPVAGGSASRATKKVKTEDGSSEINWQEALAKGELERMVMPTLKAFLKSRGLSTAGKKVDLVGRITKQLQEE